MKSSALVIAVAAAATSQANLLNNGSFEMSGAFVPDGNNTMSLPSGSVAMPSWTVGTAEIAWINQPNPFGITPDDGNFSLDLMGYHDSFPTGSVSQSFATNQGWTYSVTFDIGRNTEMVVSAAGSQAVRQHFSQTDPFWMSQSWSFTAGAGSSTTLSFFGGAGTHPQYAGLDNIDVEVLSTPEPASFAILGLGAAAAIRRRRK